MPSRSVSTETPVQPVSSFDHFVTQWMSTVNVSCGSARNSSHVHETASSTAPSIVKLHSSSAVRGGGPAERTGKSLTVYWPGGTRDGSTSRRRRPPKPREMGAMGASLSDPEGLGRGRGRERRMQALGEHLGRVAVQQPA